MNTTPIELPSPISAYFQAANAHQTDALVAAFAPDAVVVDESREYRGAAIAEWSDKVNEAYQANAEILDVAGMGKEIVVTARVSGTFPGSPISIRYHFTIESDRIAALHIEA